MELIFPLICFFSGWHLIWSLNNMFSIRHAFLVNCIITGAFVVTSTEILSLFKLITYQHILGCWILLSAGLLFILYRHRNILKIPKVTLKPYPKSITAGIAFIGIIIGITAIQAAPNTPDALIYHLPRVEHWLQNHSLGHYPAFVQYQLYMPPFTEMSFLHIKVLTGNDLFVNCVQWGAMMGCGIGISLIAQLFGCNKQRQLYAVGLLFTIPVVILQASGPKNDIVLAFWLVTAFYLIYQTTITNVTLFHHSLIGLSLGLAIMTKGTALIYTPPLMVYYGFSMINKLKIKAWKPLLIVLALALIVNLNHYRRNNQLYGTPLGVEKTKVGSEYFNQIFSPAMLVSNIVRNMALHWGLPNSVYIENLESGLQHFHQWLGIKIDHSGTTYNAMNFNIPFSNNEDTAGNPLHFILITIAIFLFLISGQLRSGKFLSIHFAILISQFLLFCIAFKWNIWNTRLHIPLFILWCPFIVKSFSRVVSERGLKASCLTLMVMALPWVLYNYSRPILFALDWQKYHDERIKTIVFDNIWNKSRLDQYFFRYQSLKMPYTKIAQKATKDCAQFAVIGGTTEYLLWKSIEGQHPHQELIIRNIKVQNSSKKAGIKRSTFLPCKIIAKKGLKNKDTIVHKSKTYKRTFTNSPLALYKLVNDSTQNRCPNR